jgi:diguanylate cyclase (GGDEF)-like protein
MAIDLPTLMVSVMLVSAVAGAAVLYVGTPAGADASLRLWGASLLLYALQPLAFAWRTVGPLAPSVFAANAVAALVLTLQWAGVARFLATPPPGSHDAPPTPRLPSWPWLALPPAVAATGALLLLPHDSARNGFTSLVLTLLALTIIAQTRTGPALPQDSSRGRQLLLGGTALLAVVLVWRGTAIVAAGVTASDLSDASGIHARTYLFTLVTLLLQTLGFVLWQQERAVEREHLLAVRDPLTGCLNRRALFEVASGILDGRPRRPRPIAVLLLDLDLFKAVNDQHGHLAGDAVLREVARRLQLRLRANDRLARFGGEEFLVLADDTDDAGARVLAEELRQIVGATPIVLSEVAIPLTVSIGVQASAATESAATIDTLIAGADAALYRAKCAGRDRIA